MALGGERGAVCSMARKWSGFLPQNLTAKEEWDLIESCEHQIRQVQESDLVQEPPPLPLRREPKKPLQARVLKPK